MNNNPDESLDFEEEDYFPHRHNFSALNSIKFKEPTEAEIEARKKDQEILNAIKEYEMLYTGMHELMYKAALNGENLDEEYENLKGWLVFM
jgi:hypothetical protein